MISSGQLPQISALALTLIATASNSTLCEEATLPAQGWRALFDGVSLAGWKRTNFGGEGEVRVVEGVIRLEPGGPLTGITWEGPATLPGQDYELRLSARRVEGHDFFCGLTFPYLESNATLILGGWGGSLVGISSLNNRDASENETMRVISFENGRWYAIRIQVTAGRIQVWLDERRIIDCHVEGRKVDTRMEVDLSKPLGVATYDTRGELREIAWRPIQ